MAQHPPKGFVVLWTTGFNSNDYMPSANRQRLAILIPRADVATLSKLKGTLARRTQIGVGENLGRIISNCIAYGGHYAFIDQADWELLCTMETFDHIYPTEKLDNTALYDIRVSKGPWKADIM
ncbi:hypothetical protein K440DRAFT_625188 [Wilcoxina mikolae CBS 423.85]|nr:hypothetical protein K440DRAFT_625188 [Wilcoxina mikolae CBS 423.85]